MAQKWYIIHTYSGFEQRVKAAIMERAKARGLEHLVSVGTRTSETRCSRPRALARSIMAAFTLCSKPE